MATPSIETARGWLGRVMVDRDSNKIGEVVDIYLDNETGGPSGRWCGPAYLACARVLCRSPRRGRWATSSRCPAGWPGTGRTGWPDRHAGRDEQAGATAAHVPKSASSATGGLADTGIDAEPGASASGSGSSELDREPPDTSILESELGRGDARDGLSATGGGEPVEAAGQDRLPVGKG